ncbi:MAG: hypothetical protein H0W02_07190 [Ktedonobacteraceae bacterium]|nr:hypothetical protein [Ktedonobacteraceae bacterium]
MLNIGKCGKYVIAHFRQQSIVGLAVMLSLTLGMLATVPEAFATPAKVGPCRGDPIITLSNGYQVSLSVAISLPDATNISSVLYTVHVPTGVSLVSVVYTPGPLQQKERVLFFADQPANQYTGDFLVNASSVSAAVTAYVSAGGHKSLIVTNGLTNHPIHIAVSA